MAKKKENAAEKEIQARIEDYKELIVKKDQLLKESLSLKIKFVQEYGELTADVFKAKIECIRLKKTISHCQALVNKGQKVDVEKMNAKIDGEMRGYYAELKQIINEKKMADESVTSDAYSSRMAKTIYYRIAKVLHPDINSKTEKTPRLSELWNEVTEAYRKSDVDTLEDLEIKVNIALEELGEKGFEVDIKDLEKRIERLEKQISNIVTTQPYTYSDILYDADEREKYRKNLEKELEEYKNYALSLEEVLAELMFKGGATLTWRMN